MEQAVAIRARLRNPTAKRRPYLLHDAELGRFRLGSDTAVPTFGKSARVIVEALPEDDILQFRALQYSIGGMMAWPSNRVDGKQTPNCARGFRRKVSDRLDLTLECVRRHYAGEHSPLGDVLTPARPKLRALRGLRGLRELLPSSGPR